MDFTLSEEQRLLKDSAERLVRADYDLDTRRRIVADDNGYSRDIWAKFAELGWLALPFDEADDGIGGGADDVMVLMEQLGRGIVIEPYLYAVLLAGQLVAKAGSDTQRQAVLPGVMTGETLLALAHSERPARFALNHVATTATKSGNSYRLSGEKSVVFFGAQANRLVVSARTAGDVRDENGISLFLVDPTASGVEIRGYQTIDGLRAADITLTDVTVVESDRLGPEGEAFGLTEDTVDRATAAVCAEALGVMSVLYEMTLEYSKTRQQFGQPIGRFQAVQHRLVEMFMDCEETRSLVYMATLSLDQPRAERMRAVSAAKAQVGRAGRQVGQEAVQLHGGMGVTEELAVGHYFKRLTMIDALFGNTDHHLNRFAAVTQ